MSLFENIDETDEDILFLKNNVDTINNWTELECSEIIVDSKYDLWTENKSYLLANYIHKKKNLLYAFFSDAGMFGMFSSEELKNYTGEELVYIEKGYQFFTFHISHRVHIPPRQFQFTHPRNELIGIPSQYDYDQILTLKDGFVLDKNMIVQPNKRDIQRYYGFQSMDVTRPIPIKRLLIVECTNPAL